MLFFFQWEFSCVRIPIWYRLLIYLWGSAPVKAAVSRGVTKNHKNKKRKNMFRSGSVDAEDVSCYTIRGEGDRTPSGSDKSIEL